MDVDELGLRVRNVEQRVALRGHFAHPPADQQHEIGRFHARRHLRIDAGAEIAGVAGMDLRKEMQAAERRHHRNVEPLREAHRRGAGGLRPAAAAKHHDRLLGRPQHLLQLRHVGEAGPGLDHVGGKRVADRDALHQHVFGQRDHHRAGPSVHRDVKRARDDFGDARRVVDLGRPFHHGAEHGAVVELLERLALAHLARDLTDEHDHRRGILLGDVQAGRAVGRAGAAGHERDARAAGQLAGGLGHHHRPALLAADGHGDVAVMEGVERRQIALARHAEDVAHAVDQQLVDQHLAAAAQIVLAAHSLPPVNAAGHYGISARGVSTPRRTNPPKSSRKGRPAGLRRQKHVNYRLPVGHT